MRKDDFTIVDVTQPKDGYTVLLNRYWLCKEGLPQQAIFYKNFYPQCNISEQLVKHGAYRNLECFDYFVQVVFIPVAYVKPLPQ